MAKTTLKTDFTSALRLQLKAAVGRGYSVNNSAGKARLRVTSDGKCWAKTLDIPWAIDRIPDIISKVSDLKALIDQGITCDDAWSQLHPLETAEPELGAVTPIVGVNWKALAAAYYRDRQQNGKKVSDKTIKLEQRYVSAAVSLLTGPNAPRKPYALIDEAIKDEGLTDKGRARQQCVDAIVRFLNYGMAHHQLDEGWELKQFHKLTLKGGGSQPREVAILSDHQILELLDAAPSESWRNLLLVMAVYGLRPEEVVHLETKVNPATEKLQLWCKYQKAAGGRTKKVETKARWLEAVPMRTPEGDDYPAGDLAMAIHNGLMPFPPLKERGAAVNQYLLRLGLWKQMAEEFEAQGKWLRPYSFRNTYSVRAHLRGIPSASVALAMGHSDKTHSDHYVTAEEGSTSLIFDEILGR
ncbi:hypothetical protein MITS9509_00974 [Synechococcus sp. MIT S9509]|uniref:tyrosine-type recombinase/integrase n=1 Tax=Synechococcus sp. MIT S9509 TaxID=1801630 RepID=UPI0007BBAF58|nr:tyrosine-type recombinase/integrase [Synechococcus sp. MIT S9509]KZR93097.1 hypothetical protein MITS9509_00974 [Synechococcus sp. MIT S9509]